jgi:acyl carrier protein
MPATVTADAVEKTIIDALPQFGVDEADISRDSTFEDLDIDSLDLVELAQVIEDEYKIEVTDADMDKIATVQDVVDFVAERQQS